MKQCGNVGSNLPAFSHCFIFELDEMRLEVMDKCSDFKKLNEENYHQYIWRLDSLVQSGKYKNWKEITPFVNMELFEDDESQYRDESAYRKAVKYARDFYEANVFGIEDEYFKKLQIEKRELEREKIKFRDERNAWNKQNYIDARVEEKLDLLEKELLSQGKINFDVCENVNTTSDNDILVILSDFHIGQCFSSQWGEYNSDIAKRRLSQLLDEVAAIQKTHKSENCFISLQGDMLSGSIHKTIQVANRENVIEQIKVASELISSFCYEVSKIFNKVYMSSVVGNHSRIDRKDDALHDERLDDIISWGIELSLKHIDNFYVLKQNYDSGIAEMNIRGKSYIAVHGDYDKYTNSGVSNLCMYLGFIPYAITYGHLHTCAVDEASGVKMIRGGSLAGSGDDYTIEKRLSGKPSQMVCVCNDNGVVCYYPIELD